MEKVAVQSYSARAGDTFYSYSLLQEKANRLSNVLVAQGVQRRVLRLREEERALDCAQQLTSSAAPASLPGATTARPVQT